MAADTLALRAMNDHLRNFLRDMLADLSDEQINYNAPAIDGRSIADIAVHAYCSILIFTNAIAGKGWPEMPAVPTTLADLLTLLDSTHDQLEQFIAALPEGALEQSYKMPWGQEMQGLEAFAGALGHSFVHIGNIQGVRAIGGFPTPPENY